MSNEGSQHVLYLKDQVLRFASPKNHTHNKNDILDENEEVPILDNYAEKSHSSPNTDYGVASTTNYGHVKLNNEVNGNNTNSNMPVSATGILNYVTDSISSLRNEINSLLDNKVVSSTDEEIENKNTNDYIPSMATMVQAISEYNNTLEGIDLKRPRSTTESINNITDAGYYEINSPEFLSIGNAQNGFLEVIKKDNSVIQKLYPVKSLIGENDEEVYEFTGDIYIRNKNISGWQEWKVLYKPPTRIFCIDESNGLGDNVDPNSISIRENTSGFVIQWEQNQTEDKSYIVTSPQYQYKKICSFSPELPIDGPYIFGNVIGRMDVKITSTGIELRTNIPAGGKIVQVNETYFIPRNN